MENPTELIERQVRKTPKRKKSAKARPNEPTPERKRMIGGQHYTEEEWNHVQIIDNCGD